jgi:hypothetical protein
VYRFYPNLLLGDYVYWQTYHADHKEYVESWASCLIHVHVTIVEDVIFVEKKWYESLDALKLEAHAGPE